LSIGFDSPHLKEGVVMTERILLVDYENIQAVNLSAICGQAAYQAKRTTTDIVTIHFSFAEQKAFWRPVHDAGRYFLGNLSAGISQAITAVAYILPWLFVVIPGLLKDRRVAKLVRTSPWRARTVHSGCHLSIHSIVSIEIYRLPA
jgi:hypothetical protein